MSAGRCPVLVFARAPVPGATKRRLQPALGPEGAARLHRRMLESTVAAAREAGCGPVELWCTPDAAHPVFHRLRERGGVVLRRQRGRDLGARMLAALSDSADPAGGALLVGTDCPGLGPEHLRTAAAALRGGADAVIGPATDGGYVLIGVRRADPVLFAGPRWGGATVLRDTRIALMSLGWCWDELPPRTDIDRPADLQALPDGWGGAGAVC